MVVQNEQFKTAPYSDSSSLTEIMKCVMNSMLFFLAVSKSIVAVVSEKYHKAVAKLPCAVTRVIVEKCSTTMQVMNDLHLVLHSVECQPFWQVWYWTFVSDRGCDHNLRGRCTEL